MYSNKKGVLLRKNRITCLIAVNLIVLILAFGITGCSKSATEKDLTTLKSEIQGKGPNYVTFGTHTLSEDETTLKIPLVFNDIIGVYGFQFDVVYDNLILEFVEIQKSDYLTSLTEGKSFCRSPDDQPGRINSAACTSLGDAEPTDFDGPMYIITFKTKKQFDSTTISLEDVKILDGSLTEKDIKTGSIELIWE